MPPNNPWGGYNGNPFATYHNNMVNQAAQRAGFAPPPQAGVNRYLQPGGGMAAPQASVAPAQSGVVPNTMPRTPPPLRYDGGGGIGGLVPSAANQSPITQQQYQRYAGMTTEQLEELSARLLAAPPTNPQRQLVMRALQQKRTQPNAGPAPGTPQQPQGGIAALNPDTAFGTPQAGGIVPGQQPQMAKGGVAKMAQGGLSLSQMTPWWARAESHGETGNGGLLHSSVAGRTDHLPISPPSGSYVIPADVMSGLGEGNSLAGARVMDDILGSGPYGTSLGRGGRGMGPPRAPRTYAEPHMSKGGDTKGVPILAAGGEYIVHPDDLVRKFGDVKKGHKVLDKFVVRVRKDTAKKMLKLPGPKK